VRLFLMNEEPLPNRTIGRTAAEMQRAIEDQPGVCPICRFTALSMQQYVDYLFYERVTDRDTREAIRAARGFCPRHTRLVRRQADVLGTALIYVDVLTNELRALDAGRFDTPPNTTSSFARLFDGGSRGGPPAAPCPLCMTERETEERTVDGFLEGMGNADFAALFARTVGLCLPHFHLAFDRCKEEAVWMKVLEMEKRVLKGLTEELAELARKYDYRFRQEARGAESDSWLRALNLASGWPED